MDKNSESTRYYIINPITKKLIKFFDSVEEFDLYVKTTENINDFKIINSLELVDRLYSNQTLHRIIPETVPMVIPEEIPIIGNGYLTENLRNFLNIK